MTNVKRMTNDEIRNELPRFPCRFSHSGFGFLWSFDSPSPRPSLDRMGRGTGCSAIELSPRPDDSMAPSPPSEGGEGRGEEGCWPNLEAPLPNPLPVRASRREGED